MMVRYILLCKILTTNMLLFIPNLLGNEANMNKLENFYKNRNVLVTGGAGFIGSHLVEKLVALNSNVTILDDLSTGTLENLKNDIDKIKFINGSIVDFQTCNRATENIDTVFHLAAYTSVPGSLKNPDLCNKINVIGTINILEASRQNKVKQFIFSSSSAVYGNLEGICSEEAQCNPTSLYGLSKLIGEHYCKTYSSLFNINAISLRYFNVYGSKQNPKGEYAAVRAKFKENMAHNVPISIYGDGQQTRDFVPVENVVEANLLLATASQTNNGNVFNIASGKSITILQLIEELKKEFPNYNIPVSFSPARAGDIKISQANCSRYQKFVEKTFNN